MYKIGTTTLVYDYNITTSLSADAVTDTSDPFEIYPNSTASARFEGSINTPIGSCTWLLNVRDFSGPSGKARRFQGSLSSFSDSDSDTIDTTGSEIAFTNGKFSMSCPCDVCIVLDQVETLPDDAKKYFWKRIEDSPNNTNLRIVVVPQPGATTTGSLTLGSLSLSVSGNVGATPAIIELDSTYVGFITSGATANGGSGSGSGSGAGSITLSNLANVLKSTFPGNTRSQSSTNSSCSVTVASESITLESASSASGVASGTSEAEGSRTFAGDRTAQCSGIVAHTFSSVTDIALPISQSLTATLFGMTDASKTFTGTWSSGVFQQRCNQSISAKATGTPNTFSNSVNTYTTVSAELTSASLSAVGFNSSSRRHMFRGEEVLVANVTQDSETLVDNCNSLTPTGDYAGHWSINSGWSLSAASGEILFSGTNPNATLTRHFDTGKGFFAGYRFLQIDFYSDNPTTFTLEIQSLGDVKRWNLKNSGVAGAITITIDLMFPDERTEKFDSTNSRYPEDENEYPQEGIYYGVGRVSHIKFTKLQKDIAFKIANIKLARQSVVTGEFTNFNDKDNYFGIHSLENEALREWKPENVVAEVGTTTRYYTNRGIIVQQDAIGNSLEEGSLHKAVTTGGATSVESITYSHRSLNDVISRLHLYPGVNIVEANTWTPSGSVHPPAKYEFYNLTVPIAYCYGSGLLAKRDGWKIASGIDLVNFGIVQPVFDSISTWPTLKGNQDWFQLADATISESSRPFTLKFGTIVNSSVYGEVSYKNEPAEGKTVNVEQASVNRGSDTTGTDGWYHTTTPSVLSGAAIAKYSSTDVDFTSITRLLQRVIFRAVKNLFGNLITGFSKYGTITACFNDTALEIRLDNTNDLLDTSTDYETIVGLYQSIVTGRLYILEQSEDICRLYHSFDSGKTSKLMLEIECSTIAVASFEEAGVITLLYEDSTDGIVKYKISPNNGIDFNSGNISFASSTVEGSVKGLYYNKKGKLHALITGTDDITRLYASFDFGKTWKQR